MTSALRRAHQYIWLFLRVIAALIIVFAIKDLDVFSSKSTTISQSNGSKKRLFIPLHWRK